VASVGRSLTLREQAEKVVEENYHRLQPVVEARVRQMLAANKMELAATDIEESYLLAWQKVCLMVGRGEQIENLGGMLVTIARRQAIDTYREHEVGQHAEVNLDVLSSEVDIAALLDDHIKLGRLIKLAARTLSKREANAWVLCTVHGYSRAEAAELLKVRRVQIEKLMDHATKKVARVVGVIAERGCGDHEWSGVMEAYARGDLDEQHPDFQRAAAHESQCESCRYFVRVQRGLGAVLPPPVLWLPAGVGAAHAGGLLGFLGGAGGHSRVAAAASEAAEHARRLIRSWNRASGWSMSGSLNTGMVAKGVAVVAVVGATAGAVTHSGAAPHPARSHRVRLRATQAAVLPASSAPVSAEPTSHARSRGHHRAKPRHARPAAPPAVTASSGRSPAPVEHAAAPSRPRVAAPASAAPSSVGGQESPHEESDPEFEFERP
jgi:DNA-directed RNA polymerase specialized sigma24 family protein